MRSRDKSVQSNRLTLIVRKSECQVANATQLVEVNSAIPARLYARYVSVLINQSRSNAIHGAPAAKKAVFDMPSEVITVFLREINLDYLNQFPQRRQLQRILDAYKSDFPDENATLLNDFISLEEDEFDKRYNR